MERNAITFRRILLATVAILTVTAVGAKTVYAHELQSEGAIHVIMHLDPDDNPIAGKQSTLVFYVFDKQENFSGAHCDCNVNITMDGTNLLSKPINIGDKGYNHVGELPFNFPMFGDYQINFSGNPIDGSSFQAFNLTFKESVSSSDPPSDPDKPFFIIFGLVILGMAGLVIWVAKEFKNE